MKRAFVTGAQSFTARYLVPELQARGYEVHGLIRPGAGNAPGGLIPHDGDLLDLPGLTESLAATRPEAIFHLAGIAFVAHGDIDEIYTANVIGTRNLLQAIVESRISPDAVLLASSANVYGNKHSGALDEETRPEPANDYGVSKLAAEFVARLFMDSIPLIIARPFNYTGVGQSPNFLIPKIVDHARRGAETIQLGNVDVERDFSDVRTVAEAYARLIEAPAARGRTFNICSGRAYSLREVLGMVEQIAGRKMNIEINPAFVRANEVATLYGDNRRLLNAIGELQPRSLEDTLRWMLAN